MASRTANPGFRLFAAAALALLLLGATPRPTLAADSGPVQSAKAVLVAIGLAVVAIDKVIDKAQELLRGHPEDRELGGMVAGLGGDRADLEELKKILDVLIRQQITAARYKDWCEDYGSESEETQRHMKVLRKHLRQIGYSETAVAQIEQNAEDAARALVRAHQNCD